MLHFVVNPKAGKNKGMKNFVKIEKFLQGSETAYDVRFSNKKGEITTITREICGQEGAKIIAIVGGDGTLHEALNGITDFENTTVGIVPSGSGNDFADFLGFPKDPVEAVKIILNGKTEYSDFIEIADERDPENPAVLRSLNVAGTGLDTEVLKRCKRFKLVRGKLQYALALIFTLFRYKCRDYTLTTDGSGEKITGKGFVSAASNGERFGGGIKISPRSDNTDGKINLIIIDKIRRIKYIGALIRLLRGRVFKIRATREYITESFEISSDTPLTLNLDGELYENMPSFKGKTVSGQLRIFR